MNKVISGIVGLIAVTGIVAGIGYALFTSQATMSGMVLGTATPGIQISHYNKSNDTPVGYGSNLEFPPYAFQKLLPGEMDWGAFYLKNNSTAGMTTTATPEGDTLDFSLQGSIVTAAGDWNILKNVIKMKVCVLQKGAENWCDTSEGNQTIFKTLAEWKSTQQDLPGGALLQGESRAYVVVFFIDSSVGNSFSGQTIEGMQMQVTGTQQ
jgi:hypothetical protein